MPMLKIKGIPQEEVMKESKELIDELVEIIECPRDYFTIELINTTFIMDGEVVAPPTIIEVAWFDRGQEVQDTVAKIITNNIRENLNIESMDLAFTVFEKEKYYENGEHF